MTKAEMWAWRRFPVDMQLEPTCDGGVIENDANRFVRRWAERIYDEVVEELMKDALTGVYGQSQDCETRKIYDVITLKGHADVEYGERVKVIVIKDEQL